jgi:hypothetical protein
MVVAVIVEHAQLQSPWTRRYEVALMPEDLYPTFNRSNGETQASER